MPKPKYKGIIWEVKNNGADIVPYFTCETKTLDECHKFFNKNSCLMYIKTIFRVEDNNLMWISCGVAWKHVNKLKWMLCNMDVTKLEMPSDTSIVEDKLGETWCVRASKVLTRDEWGALNALIEARWDELQFMTIRERRAKVDEEERVACGLGKIMFSLWSFKKMGYDITPLYPISV